MSGFSFVFCLAEVGDFFAMHLWVAGGLMKMNNVNGSRLILDHRLFLFGLGLFLLNNVGCSNSSLISDQKGVAVNQEEAVTLSTSKGNSDVAIGDSISSGISLRPEGSATLSSIESNSTVSDSIQANNYRDYIAKIEISKVCVVQRAFKKDCEARVDVHTKVRLRPSDIKLAILAKDNPYSTESREVEVLNIYNNSNDELSKLITFTFEVPLATRQILVFWKSSSNGATETLAKAAIETDRKPRAVCDRTELYCGFRTNCKFYSWDNSSAFIIKKDSSGDYTFNLANNSDPWDLPRSNSPRWSFDYTNKLGYESTVTYQVKDKYGESEVKLDFKACKPPEFSCNSTQIKCGQSLNCTVKSDSMFTAVGYGSFGGDPVGTKLIENPSFIGIWDLLDIPKQMPSKMKTLPAHTKNLEKTERKLSYYVQDEFGKSDTLKINLEACP